jgi:hypothetical protein
MSVPNKLWSGTEETAEACGFSVSRLRELKLSGELTPGVHWVYLTGRRSGPVGWSIEAIHQWQRQITRQIVDDYRGNADAIETFEEAT